MRGLVASFLIIVLMLGSAGSISAGAGPPRFTDVGPGHWADQPIEQAAAAGFIKGYPDGTFRPEEPIRRAEFLAILTRAFPVPGDPGAAYPDVPASHWAAGLIGKARGAGWLSAWPERFEPDRYIIRAEMAVMLQAALALPAPDALPAYPDLGGRSAAERGAIAALTARGILTGYADGSFGPERTTTRAEAAALMERVSRPAEPEVPVLLYHDLQPGADTSNPAVVPVSEFRRQMTWLKTNGYSAITADGLADWLQGRGELPGRPVLITFDDGYRSVYDHAYPILRELGLKGTVFVVSGSVGIVEGRPKLTWEQMLEVQKAGVLELQAHTHAGHHLAGGAPVLLGWSEGQVLADLHLLEVTFALAGLRRPSVYAYPYGAFDEDAVRALTAAGIRLGFTVRPGRVRRGDAPMALRRQIVYPGTSECEFARLVAGPAFPCSQAAE